MFRSPMLAALLGLAVGLGLIFTIEFLDDSIRYLEEVPRSVGVPPLGLIPTAHWKRTGDASYWVGNLDPSSGFAESYRNIRSALLLNPTTRQFKTLAVTSTVPKEGKTTTSANLATSFAQAGQKVLMVDIDLHRGGLHRFFGLQAGRGLSEILHGEATLAQVVQHTSVAGLDMIGTGAFPDNPAELVLRPQMKAFLAEASQKYDLVVLDAPPVLAVSESSVIASLVDGTLLVVNSAKTKIGAAQIAEVRLQVVAHTLLNVLLAHGQRASNASAGWAAGAGGRRSWLSASSSK